MDSCKPLEAKKSASVRLRISLDVARAFAALYVVLHHLSHSHDWKGGIFTALRFGQEAVLIFFLLSGFVIFANERERAMRPKGYFLRRLRRIYPALLAAMLVASLVSLDNRTFRSMFQWPEFLGTLLSLQDTASLKPGVIVDPYLHNLPLWSLSYEVAFYVAFPFVLRLWTARPALAHHVVGMVCCLSYVVYVLHPNHWALVSSYFLVWWAGAMAAEAYLGGVRSAWKMGAPLYWLFALVLVSLASVLAVGWRGVGVYPFLMARHFGFAALMLVLLFGPVGRTIAASVEPLAKPAAALASVSYGLYLMHVPILVNWHRAQSSWGFAVACACLAAAAFLADRTLNRYLPRAPAN